MIELVDELECIQNTNQLFGRSFLINPPLHRGELTQKTYEGIGGENKRELFHIVICTDWFSSKTANQL